MERPTPAPRGVDLSVDGDRAVGYPGPPSPRENAVHPGATGGEPAFAGLTGVGWRP